MAEVRIAGERAIAAAPDLVYRLIADYREHHPRFLPPAFSDFEVKEGGVGAGTIVHFRVTVAGRGRDVQARVEEPEPGRRLIETDVNTGTVTSFTVTPEGEASRVRIETVGPSSPGLAGVMERLLAPRLLARLYADELERLDAYARGQATP